MPNKPTKAIKAIKAIKINELVRLVWTDSFVSPGWNNPHRGAPDARPIVTVGYVQNATSELIQIAHTKGLDGQILAPVSIPKGAVLKLEALRKDKWVEL
jgi:hypothetical protein